MPQYRWRAIDLSGAEHQGVLWATSVDQLENELIDQDLGLMHAERVPLGRFFDRLTHADRLAFFQQLRRLVSAGFLMPAALDLIARQGRPFVRALAEDLARSVAGGLTLAQGLELWPAYFDDHLIAIVRSGQESGTLEQALGHVCLLLQARLNLRNQVSAAIRMPLATLGFFLASVLVILLVVVPQFEQILTLVPPSASQTSTTFLFGASRAMRRLSFIHILLGVTALALVWVLFKRAGWWQKMNAEILEKTPFIGNISAMLALGLFFQSVALLLAGGKSLVEAVKLASVGTPPGNLRIRLQQFAHELDAGVGIGAAYNQALGPLADPEIEAFLVTGYATGLPEPAVQQVADLYAQRCQRSISRVAILLQPMLMLCLGLLVGLLVYGVYVPLAQLPASFEHLY